MVVEVYVVPIQAFAVTTRRIKKDFELRDLSATEESDGRYFSIAPVAWQPQHDELSLDISMDTEERPVAAIPSLGFYAIVGMDATNKLRRDDGIKLIWPKDSPLPRWFYELYHFAEDDCLARAAGWLKDQRRAKECQNPEVRLIKLH